MKTILLPSNHSTKLPNGLTIQQNGLRDGTKDLGFQDLQEETDSYMGSRAV